MEVRKVKTETQELLTRPEHPYDSMVVVSVTGKATIALDEPLGSGTITPCRGMQLSCRDGRTTWLTGKGEIEVWLVLAGETVFIPA